MPCFAGGRRRLDNKVTKTEEILSELRLSQEERGGSSRNLVGTRGRKVVFRQERRVSQVLTGL